MREKNIKLMLKIDREREKRRTLKVKGRPKASFKVRSIKGITPKGFKLHKINQKQKKVVFKRK